MTRELIMDALNRCEPYVIPECCGGCPYEGCWGTKEECITQLHADTYALLKAQEPQVMTLEEACGRDACFYEYRATGYIEPASVVMSGLLLNDSEPLADVYRLGREGPAYVPIKDYGHEWRCWDRMPDDEQRMMTPWE